MPFSLNLRSSTHFISLLFFLTFMPSTFSSPASSTIRHVVCFKFKDSAKKSEIERIEKEFSALKDKIPGILSLEWGKNNSPENLNKDSLIALLLPSKMRRPVKFISHTQNIWPLFRY